MNKSNLAIFTALFSLFTLASAALGSGGEGPSVTLPLEQYLELKRQTEAPSTTTIEEIRFLGDIKKPGDLSVQISGASAGLMPAVAAFEQAETFSLSGCEGGAMLKVQDGRISVVPMKPRFQLVCRLVPKTETEITMTVLNALYVKNSVAGADLISRTTSYERKEITLARTEPARATISGPVSASGRYQVSIHPDDTRFRYFFSFFNPNKGLKQFDLALRNAETIQEVQTSVTYEESPGSLRFKLPPGETTVVLTGRLGTVKFTPLLDSSQQFVLLEAHPLLQITPETKARRISVSESGMAPRFAGAIAFYMRGGDDLGWASRKLAVFESQGYTIERADYLYFVPRQGAGIVEAGFRIHNKGTPEVPLGIPGQVTYLEIDSMPQALYKDPNGKLLVHLPSGEHSILVQYRPDKTFRGLAGAVSESLVKPETVISDMSLRLLVDRDWKLVFGKAISDYKTLVSIRGIAIFFAIAWVYLLFFRYVGLSTKQALACAFGPAGLFWYRPAFLTLIVMALVLAFAWKKRAVFRGWFQTFRSFNWKQAAFAGVAFCAVLFVVQSVLLPLGYRAREAAFLQSNIAYDQEGSMSAMNMPAAPAAAMMDAMEAGGGGNDKARRRMMKMKGAMGAAANYNNQQPRGAVVSEKLESERGETFQAGGTEGFQGIPARIQIPRGGVAHFFQHALVEKNSPILFHAGFISTWVLDMVPLLMILFAGFVAFRNRWNFRFG